MTADDPVPFGVRLRRLRESAGMTQEDLAEKAGLSVQGIASLENGRSKRPYPHTLRALGDALSLTTEEQAALAANLPPRRAPLEDAALAAAPIDGTLPARVTEVIGREGDVAALEGMLRQGVRFITLTGPGGVGKTSLAVRLAHDVADCFPDGVTFVPLAPVDNPALVLPTIARALQIPEAGHGGARAALESALTGKRALLVLDNLEQAVDAAVEIAGLVAALDGVTVLVTSRAPLRVRNEREYPVQPLAVPDLARVPTVEDVAGNPAVALFVERARAVAPAFNLEPANAAVIAAICRRLDGLPLAIELAAARVRALSPMDLLARLDSALPLLTGGARDLPERQQTMRGAIAWSHDLLGEDERSVFAGLAVFRGGWTLEAAETVAAGHGVAADDVMTHLATLVEQSLVVAGWTDDGATRYRYLVPVREFAEEHLEGDGRAGEVRRRHAEWCLGLAAEAAAGLTGPGQVEWLSRLELERDNLRAAMTWLVETRDWDAATRLGWDLWVFWWIHGYHAEGREWMERVLCAGDGLVQETRARALGIRASMALGQGDIATALASGEESAALFRSLGDARSAARDGLVLGLIASARGDVEQAQTWLGEAAEVFRQAGADFWAALSVSALGMLPFRAGDFDRAEPLLAEGHRLSLEAGDRLSRYIALYNQARVAQSRGDLTRAADLYREVLLFSLEAGDRANIAYCLEGLAAVAVARGDAGRAARLLGAAQGLFDLVGSRVYTYRPDTRLREETLAIARSRLDARVWDRAWDAGTAMSVDEAFALAMASVEGTSEVAGDERPGSLTAEVRVMTTYGLTRREVEVLKLFIAHRSYREMAEALFISPRTVGTHITSIRAKLDATSPADVHRIAAEMGLRGR